MRIFDHDRRCGDRREHAIDLESRNRLDGFHTIVKIGVTLTQKLEMIRHLHHVHVILVAVPITTFQIQLFFLRKVFEVEKAHITGCECRVTKFGARDLGDAIFDVVSEIREHLLVEGDRVHDIRVRFYNRVKNISSSTNLYTLIKNDTSRIK
ncbi:hypothetical protein AR158_C172R [Paramecium bursaria Chlorella virus AR158]|uniref:hypothetical protein n=1 Tax=Paramecium bursaria Chlorella virus AR158 TaxID=380598 RepID=UPI00015AA824|nr:hypothetical protein AR158_C172R [Paramecium bursaria Chlorella virus AR158]ABU43718.1 hypothetical protein AR158_C172R [Paramecium bursaria Chlorella virus AR158]